MVKPETNIYGRKSTENGELHPDHSPQYLRLLTVILLFQFVQDVKRSLVILFLVVSAVLRAQTDSVVTFPAQKLGYVFSIGLNKSPQVLQRTGVTVGFGSEFFLTEKLALRPQLMISFLSYKVRPDVYVETTVFEVPLQVIYRPFSGKWSPYFAAGGSGKLDVMSMTSRWFADASIGIERDFGYSAFGPEIRCSFGKEMQMIYGVLNFRF
jgi:hypothetical protein